MVDYWSCGCFVCVVFLFFFGIGVVVVEPVFSFHYGEVCHVTFESLGGRVILFPRILFVRILT